jgi:hypothetical protein
MHSGAIAENWRPTTSGTAGNGLDTSIKHLQCTTSGAAGNGLSRCQELLMCSFTTSALDAPCLVFASFAIKRNSTAEGCGSVAQCLFVEPEISLCVHLKKRTKIHYICLRSESRKPVPPSSPSFRLKEHQATPAPLASPKRLSSSESPAGFMFSHAPRALFFIVIKVLFY